MLPADVQFHEDVRLFVWKPRGVLDEAPLNNVLGCMEDLEAKPRSRLRRGARPSYFISETDKLATNNKQTAAGFFEAQPS